MRNAPEAGLQRGDTAALGRPAQRSQAVVAESQRAHARRERHRLTTAGRTGGSRAIPGVDGRAPQFALRVPAKREVGAVGPADRDGPGSAHTLDNGRVQTWIGFREGLQPVGGRRTDEVDVLLDGEWDAVQRRDGLPAGEPAVGSLRGFDGLFGEHDRDGVDGGVDGLDPSQVRLNDFFTGHPLGSDGVRQFRRAHSPQVGGRGGPAHPCVSWRCRRRRRRTAIAPAPAAIAASAPVTQGRGLVMAGCFWNDSGAKSKWTAVVPRPGSWLKTTRLEPVPNNGSSPRKAYGSRSSSGWSDKAPVHRP